MDIKLVSVIISASVAILIAVANHFIIEPIKERRRWKKQQLTNLYAPAYALLCAKISPIVDLCLRKERIIIGHSDLYSFLDKDGLHELILKNAGYGTMEFLDAWTEYIGSFPKPNEDTVHKFVTILVKDFNQFKKDLKQKYNEVELETGIPEVIKGLRNRSLK